MTRVPLRSTVGENPGRLDYSLRYGKSELTLLNGDLIIGRGAGCAITLDDALVSRQHARLRVQGAMVTVSDMGSRNGVLVNGRRIEKETPLARGDRVVVGTVEFELLAKPSRKDGTGVRTGQPLAMKTLDGNEPVQDLASVPEEATAHTKRPEAIALLGHVVLGALKSGRKDEAERLLQGHLWTLLGEARRGAKIGLDTKSAVARLAVSIAEATKRGLWLDHTIELFSLGPDIMPLSVITDMTRLVSTVDRVDVAILRTYLERIRRNPVSGGDRAAVQRLDELERVAVMAMTR